MSRVETAGKKPHTDNLHQVSPEELTLVYNLRKMMMNDWVSLVCTLGCVILSDYSYVLISVKLQI